MDVESLQNTARAASLRGTEGDEAIHYSEIKTQEMSDIWYNTQVTFREGGDDLWRELCVLIFSREGTRFTRRAFSHRFYAYCVFRFD